MVLIKEYRTCMPLSVEEYQIGQLYMIARHSHEQTESGEGVETVVNVACEDSTHGKGQYTEKRIHLSSQLPYWVQSLLPKVFYVTEKAWNYYPFTITVAKKHGCPIERAATELDITLHSITKSFQLTAHQLNDPKYTCSFLPKFHISIRTKFEDNNGCNDNCLNLSETEMALREVDVIDIAYDEISPKHYKEEEDLRFFQSKKTGRGPLAEGWRDTMTPVMCSYKVVEASFEVWGLQTKVEDIVHKSIRGILLLGHRQAFAWIDEWYGMSLTDVRLYESEMQRQTNSKIEIDDELLTPSSPPKFPMSPSRGWFSWS